MKNKVNYIVGMKREHQRLIHLFVNKYFTRQIIRKNIMNKEFGTIFIIIYEKEGMSERGIPPAISQSS